MKYAITEIQGSMRPIYGEDIDTDRIIPARYMKAPDFESLGKYAFVDERDWFRKRGKMHPMDDPRYAESSILVVGRNFGCGSSREHAVQALLRSGIRAIIGESFGEIFRGNSVSAGLPCFTAPAETIEELQRETEKNPQQQVRIHVANTQLISQSTIDLSMPAGMVNRFISGGWNQIGLLRDAQASIDKVIAQLPYMHWRFAGLSPERPS